MSFTADLRHGDSLFPYKEEKSSWIRKENEIITQKRRDPRAILDVLIAKSLERIEKGGLNDMKDVPLATAFVFTRLDISMSSNPKLSASSCA